VPRASAAGQRRGPDHLRSRRRTTTESQGHPAGLWSSWWGPRARPDDHLVPDPHEMVHPSFHLPSGLSHRSAHLGRM